MLDRPGSYEFRLVSGHRGALLAVSNRVEVSPGPLKASWSMPSTPPALAPGGRAELSVSLTVNQPVAGPRLRIAARSDVVVADPSALPTRLEPGRAYTLPLRVRMPEGRLGRYDQTASLWLLDERGRAAPGALTIRIKAAP